MLDVSFITLEKSLNLLDVSFIAFFPLLARCNQQLLQPIFNQTSLHVSVCHEFNSDSIGIGHL